MITPNYFNTKITHCPCTGTSEVTNHPVFGTAVEIDAYKYGSDKLIHDANGNVIAHQQVFITKNEVHVKDKVNGRLVQSAEEFFADFAHTEKLYRVTIW